MQHAMYSVSDCYKARELPSTIGTARLLTAIMFVMLCFNSSHWVWTKCLMHAGDHGTKRRVSDSVRHTQPGISANLQFHHPGA